MSDQIMQQILSELQTIKTEVAGIKTEVAEIKSEQKSMGARLDRMESDIAEIKKDTALIPLVQRAVLESHSDVTTIKNNQQEQQKILERLTYRSVSHEADIAELRRI